MKCDECELLLANNGIEIGPEADAHLAECPSCRSLSVELRANADAMRALAEDVMPPVTMPERGVPWWKWSSAAAAVIISLGAAWWASQPAKPPHIVSVDVKVTGVVAQRDVPYVKAEIPTKLTLTPAKVPIVRAVNTEPLRVKMLTSDPDVVIYWLVD